MNLIGSCKQWVLLIFGVLIFQASFSQVNYLPGYVITSQGDTVTGFVDYGNWGTNPTRISFKETIEGKPILLKPSDIKEFKVADEMYESGIVKIEVSPTQTAKLDYDPTVNLKVDTTFLQALIKGEKSLYLYKNMNGVTNFYIKRDSAFDLLIYKKYLVEQEGKYAVKENKKYIGQLAYYLGDCESISLKMNGVHYSQKSLTKAFKSYYDCSPSALTFKREVEKASLEIAVLAGVSRANLHFKGSNSWNYLLDSDYSPSFDFSGGLVFEIVLPRNQGRWSIANEILFSTYTIKGVEEKFIEEEHYSVSSIEFGYSYLKINNLVRYKYPLRRSSLFVNGGISNGFAMRDTNHWRQDVYFYGMESSVEDLAIKKARKYEQGIIVGTGIKYNKLSFEVRHEWGNGMSSYSNLTSTTKRTYFLLGYRFY
jgi:hypothetical protein